MVAQAYNDSDHQYLTYPPTVQLFSQRLLLELCATDKWLSLFMRDVSQVYVQLEIAIERQILVRPKSTICLPKGTILRVDRTFYVIPEAGLRRFAHTTTIANHKYICNPLCTVHIISSRRTECL